MAVINVTNFKQRLRSFSLSNSLFYCYACINTNLSSSEGNSVWNFHSQMTVYLKDVILQWQVDASSCLTEMVRLFGLFLEISYFIISSEKYSIIRISENNMGDTCSACDARSKAPTDEIKMQSNKELETQDREVPDETKNLQQQDKQSENGEKRGEIQQMTSKIQKNQAYHKLNKGGTPLKVMPDYSNQVSRNKREELGSFIYQIPEFEDSSAEHKGPIEFEEKYVYEGQWRSNQRNGRGIQQWKGGSIYEGYWKDNVAHGYGRLIHADGDVYFGQWGNDRANGKGTYYHSSGAKYLGDWVHDKQDGFGEESWPDGAVYKGEYVNGKKQGRGVFTWGDESCFEGDFMHNNIHGQGKYCWKDGRVYEGLWADNKMEGYGLFTWPDGRKYQGQYTNDKKKGNGVFVFKDGRVYNGEWLNGKQHGRGSYKKNSIIREGIWENGERIKWLDEYKENDADPLLNPNK